MESEPVRDRAGDFFKNQAHQLAARWRRRRRRQGGTTHALEGLLEPFIQQLGSLLCGEASRPWCRTAGVLRFSPVDSAPTLIEEFRLLRQCLWEAALLLGASNKQREMLDAALGEAAESALVTLGAYRSRKLRKRSAPFGGLVVRHFQSRNPSLSQTRSALRMSMGV
jgi:hypothetical protein